MMTASHLKMICLSFETADAVISQDPLVCLFRSVFSFVFNPSQGLVVFDRK
jgi:hypothetical protein